MATTMPRPKVGIISLLWATFTCSNHTFFIYIDNVVATGGNTANGAGNNVYTGGNGINAWGYGNNAVLTGGNVANGLGNNIGTGGNQINSGEIKQLSASVYFHITAPQLSNFQVATTTINPANMTTNQSAKLYELWFCSRVDNL